MKNGLLILIVVLTALSLMGGAGANGDEHYNDNSYEHSDGPDEPIGDGNYLDDGMNRAEDRTRNKDR